MRKGAGPVLICAALGIAFLCGLGVWQVKRLAWKTALIAQLSERMSAKPIPLADALARMKSGEDIEYLRVAVDASAGPHKVLLKQTVINGLAAWEGISGFHSTDGADVLVDLGASETGTAEVSGPTHFEALLRKHNLGQGRFDPTNNVARNNWFWWDLPAMQKALGMNNSPAVILQLVGAHDGSAFEPSEPKVELNNNHLGYAITWFGLAAALAGVAGAFVFGRERR
ncbi:MAG TPA: SURF1 family protein [Aestuariivirga sp.]